MRICLGFPDFALFKAFPKCVSFQQNLQEDHINYMKRHPELKAILGDFLQVGTL